MATGGFWSLTGTDKSLTMRSERPAPRRGAADFKGSALPADPLKENGVWYTMTFDRFGRVGGVWQQGGSEGCFRGASV